jgi:hypothetical protein
LIHQLFTIKGNSNPDIIDLFSGNFTRHLPIARKQMSQPLRGAAAGISCFGKISLLVNADDIMGKPYFCGIKQALW